MNSMGGPLVIVAVVDKMGPDRIEIDVGSCDRKVALRFDRLGVVPLLEELSRRLIALVANLSVSLSDMFHERSKSLLLKRSQQQVDVIRHETQRVSAHLQAR
jgi:hypothetical protein